MVTCDAKAVIFDLYGTLIFVANKKKLYRRVLSLKQWAQIRELALVCDMSLSEIFGKLGISLDPDVISEIEMDIRSEVRSVHCYPETIELLHWLRLRGIKLGTVSNLATPYKRPFFRLALDSLIDEYIFSCDVGFKKPEGVIFESMIQRLGVDSSEILMVGDSVASDFIGSREAGLRAILLSRVKKRGFDHEIESLEELKKLF
ncbi:HAD family hydrolase [Patescibacteria group bacterium]